MPDIFHAGRQYRIERSPRGGENTIKNACLVNEIHILVVTNNSNDYVYGMCNIILYMQQMEKGEITGLCVFPKKRFP
jgi:hypothetical protein